MGTILDGREVTDVSGFTAEAKAQLAGLWRVGKVTTATSNTVFASTDLIGQGDDAFPGWYVYVIQSDNAAPEGLQMPVNDYVSSTGTITHDDFVADDLAVDDWVALLHPSIAMLGAVGTTAATGAVTATDLLMAYVKQIVNNTYRLGENAVNDTSDKVDMTTEIVDNSILANMIAPDGDTSDYDRRRHSQMAIGNVLTPTLGQHFWADKDSGSDSNGGKSPEDPVLTITYAISLCTGGRYDVIHVMSNSPTPHANETFPIVVDKAGVTIRGEHGKGLLSDSGIGSDADTACFEIKGAYITIEDMYMGIQPAGTNHGIIEFNGTNNYFGVTIRRCLFDTQYIAAYGILVAHDQPYLLVEDCIFGGTWIAGYTTAGISIANLTGGMLRGNVFNKIQGIGISVGANAGNFQILSNKFNLPSNTVGKAITIADGAGAGIFIDDNHANFGMTAMALNPYRDLHNDNSNTWGLNYKAGLSIMPIGT